MSGSFDIGYDTPYLLLRPVLLQPLGERQPQAVQPEIYHDASNDPAMFHTILVEYALSLSFVFCHLEPCATMIS